tara:strand:- start:7127 stop:8065 length:939 start_codon:yes stop_codon:yes gene_type:complete
MESITTKNMSKREWLTNRQKGIGGSDVAKILGLSKYGTPLSVYEEKISSEPIEIPDNDAMRFGREAESIVAKFYTEDTGEKLRIDNKMRLHPEYPFLMANVDRTIVANSEHGAGIFEAKTTSGMYAKHWERDIPAEYYLQLQHYLNVTGYSWGVVAMLIDKKFEYRKFDRNDELISKMNQRLSDFWINHVEVNVPPAPINEADVLKLYPSPVEGKVCIADDNIKLTYDALYSNKRKVSELNKRIKELEGEIKLSMEDSEVLEHNGTVIATWKQSKSSKMFDKKRFKLEHQELYDEFEVESSGSRRFLVKEAS